jgi:hypothetical protein
MFKSYEHYHLVYNHKTNKYRWEYKIIDDDWGGVGVAPEVRLAAGLATWFAVEVGAAVIQEYSKRDLPVAPNLVHAFQWYSQKYGYSIEQIIALNKQHNPLYKDYEKDIEKYLVLL